MPPKRHDAEARRPRDSARAHRASAPVFAALGDPTRLALLSRLGAGAPLPIVRLTDGSTLTRQAISKHLGVLRRAGLVRQTRRGRESLFELQPHALTQARASLDLIAAQWDDALARLKSHVEP